MVLNCFFLLFFLYFLETGSQHVAQAGLKLLILLTQPPKLLGLQACTTMPGQKKKNFPLPTQEK
jgi:hypothetical protein